MSGFEVAGIVLGAFPLCIELVKLYQTSTTSTAFAQMRMRHHKRALQTFQRELGMEHTKLVNSLYELFGDEISPQDHNLLFRRDPTDQGAQPDDRRLQLETEFRLQLEAMFRRPDAAQSFIDAFEALKVELGDLEGKFQALHFGKDTENMTTIKAIQAGCKNPEILSRVANDLRKRFKFAVLQEELSVRIEGIRKINKDILILVKGAQRSAKNHNKNASKAELFVIQKYYQRVRDGAQSICNSFRSGIRDPHDCQDHEHGISLCLEMRDAAGGAQPNQKPWRPHSRSSHSSVLHFRIVFSLAESKPGPGNSSTQLWKELEVEPIDNENTAGESKQHQDDIYSDRSIPAIHVNNSEIDSQGEFSINIRSRGPESGDPHENKSPEQSQDHLEQAHASPQRPNTPTQQVFRKFVKFLRFDDSNTPYQELNTTCASTSQPVSREPTPEPVVRSGTKATCSAYDISDAHIIHDICLKIKKSSAATRDYLGFLKGNNSTYMGHALWSMPYGGCFNLANQLERSGGWHSDPVSLCTLFSTDNTNFQSPASSISLQYRLSLGIKLASSVLQLHKTLWLDGLWSKQDIVFFIDPRTKHPLIETPLVLQKLTTHQSSVNHPVCQGVAVHNSNSKILLSLGILLCELWHWRRLEDFHFWRAENLKDIPVPASDDYNQWPSCILKGAAQEALESLDFNAPTPYREAVVACLSNDILAEDEKFVSTVWEKVVCPLKRNLSHFMGET